MQAQADAFSLDVQNTSGITLEIATEVSAEVSALHSPWTPEQRATLATVLGNCAQKKGKALTGSARPNQTMLTMEKYFTEADWTFLQDPTASVTPKLDYMAQRLWRLGLTCPSIPTMKRGVAI
eukprot:988947-Pyramimonas_sp.AAC.1